MKKITEYILENYRFSKISLDESYIDKNNVKRAIDELKAEAEKKNLKVVFRDRKTNQGDFCIFIYSDRQKRYHVGFNGDWNDKSEYSFETCLTDAKKWIEDFK
ncbi:MAG: hypothetical protein J1F35_03315 [Erysipelotrichales bacterium]|nr:hypothetical protein [Erysipelotrichales bacterium]